MTWNAVRVAICVIGSLLTMLVIAGAAYGEEEYPITNQAVTNDGLLYAATAVADKVWATKGEKPCKGTIFEYDERNRNNAVAARGLINGCDTWYERDFVRWVREMVADPIRDNRVDGYQSICLVAVHERGHNLGFGHTETGVMAATVDLVFTPAICNKWANDVAWRVRARIERVHRRVSRATRSQALRGNQASPTR